MCLPPYLLHSTNLFLDLFSKSTTSLENFLDLLTISRCFIQYTVQSKYSKLKWNCSNAAGKKHIELFSSHGNFCLAVWAVLVLWIGFLFRREAFSKCWDINQNVHRFNSKWNIKRYMMKLKRNCIVCFSFIAAIVFSSK